MCIRDRIEGKEADPRSDIFAFGAVLYEMFAGKRPFEGKSQISLASSILEKDPEPISALKPSTPPAFENAVATCLQKDPEERFQTAHDVKLQLQWIASSSSSGAMAALPASPTTSTSRKRERLGWATAFVVALALGVLAEMCIRDRSRTSGASQAADRRGPHQPCALVEVLRLAIRFGDRQTRNPDRLASPAFQVVLEDEITPGQAEATQQHPSTDCSNGGRKSNLGAGSRCRRVGSEAGHSGLTANGWNVLAEPAGQQRSLIAALEQLRSQSHSIVACLRFPSRGDGRLSPVVRLRADGNWHAEDCALQCHGPSDCRLDVAAVSRSSSRRTWTKVRNP